MLWHNPMNIQLRSLPAIALASLFCAGNAMVEPSFNIDKAFARQGVELIAPHRKNRKNPAHRMGSVCAATNDGGKLNAFLRGLTNSRKQ